MNDLILEYMKNGIWILFGSGILFEVAPIKFNPISLALGWIGKKMNKDVKKDIEKLQEEVMNVKLDLQSHKIESWRRNILDFSDSLMHGENKSKENFENIIKLHDLYSSYISKNNLENGQIDLAFKYISEEYGRHMKNNDFYIGK